MVLKKMTNSGEIAHAGPDYHEFCFEKRDVVGEGAEVDLFLNSGNKTRIADDELDLGSIKNPKLTNAAVELLPTFKIREENKMDLLYLHCNNLPEIEKLLKRESRVFIGSVDRILLGSSAINLLTKMEVQKGNEMKELGISCGSLNNIEPLLKSKEDLHLGKIKNLDVKSLKNEDMEETIKKIFGTRNNVRNSWEISKVAAVQDTGKRKDMGKMIIWGVLLILCL